MLIIAARIKADAVLVAHCFGTTGSSTGPRWVNRRATLNGDLPDVRPSASVARQVLRIRSQKPKRHAALSRRRNQCRPPIGDVRPHSSLIVEGLSTEFRIPRNWFQYGNQFAENRFHSHGPRSGRHAYLVT